MLSLVVKSHLVLLSRLLGLPSWLGLLECPEMSSEILQVPRFGISLAGKEQIWEKLTGIGGEGSSWAPHQLDLHRRWFR